MLSIKNLTLAYEKNRPVLHQIDLEVSNQERVVILGPSGCGKSTLLKVISGIVDDYEGNLLVDTDHPSYVFQEDRLLPWLTASENVKLVNPQADVVGIFSELGLQGEEDTLPDKLSGGMRQRLQIARALAFNSPLMLMDEPFSSLDYMLKWRLIDHLDKVIKDHALTLMYVTHDIDEALMIASRIIVMGYHPNSIRGEYKIDLPYEHRELESEFLSNLRQEIIKDMEVSE